MRIALLTQGFRKEAPEAANITLQILAEELTKCGNEVVIFCNQIWGQPLKERINGYRVVRQKADYDSKYFWALKLLNYSSIIREEIAENGEFDIIHNFGASPLLAIRGLLARRFSKNAKLLQSIKSESENKFTYIFTPLLNLYDKVTVPNKHIASLLIKNGLKRDKIVAMPSLIDASKFRPRNKISLKRKYGYSGMKILMYYGHLSEKKGISALIEAIGRIKEENFIMLIVTGSGESYIKPYKEEIRRKKMGSRIKIIKTPIKQTKNIEEYVSMADAVVLPYPDLISTEAQPSCVIETMASKTQLITTNIKELKELVSDDAILAKARDSKSLADRMRYFLKNGANKKKIERAYKKSLEFDYKKVVKKMIELYESI